MSQKAANQKPPLKQAHQSPASYIRSQNSVHLVHSAGASHQPQYIKLRDLQTQSNVSQFSLSKQVVVGQ